MGHAGRDAQAARVGVAHEELHQLALRRRAVARVVQRDLQRADHIPPVRLALMYVPRLGAPWMHQRVAPLAELVEEVIGLADHLADEAALVGVRGEICQDDAFDAHGCASVLPASRARTKSLTA